MKRGSALLAAAVIALSGCAIVRVPVKAVEKTGVAAIKVATAPF